MKKYIFSVLYAVCSLGFCLANLEEEFELVHIVFHDKDQQGRLGDLKQMDIWEARDGEQEHLGEWHENKMAKKHKTVLQRTVRLAKNTYKRVKHRLKHRRHSKRAPVNSMGLHFTPQYDDPETIVEMAKLSSNAYVKAPEDPLGGWLNSTVFNAVSRVLMSRHWDLAGKMILSADIFLQTSHAPLL